MRNIGMEGAIIAAADLFGMSARFRVGQLMSHLDGRHPQQEWDEKHRRDQNE